MSKNIAIILSAGKGSRIKSNIPKQYIKINNKPIICYTIESFEKNNLIDEIILVVSKDYLDYFNKKILEKYKFNKIKKVILGGNERFCSVKNALDTLKLNKFTEDNNILIQDGARPFVSNEIITKGIKEATVFGSVVIGVRVKDTIKIVSDYNIDTYGNNKEDFKNNMSQNIILNTPDRKTLWIAQTPQIFKLKIIKKAYENISKLNLIPTDDSSLVESLGYKVKMIEGNYENFKITTEKDLNLAKIMLNNYVK